MSVIGIDFGNESCFIAAAKDGGIETLANDYSLRATPACVAFDGKKRIIGVAAKNQQVTNMKNTVSGFKRMLGRRFNDPHVQREICSIPTKVERRNDGSVGFAVTYLDQEQHFTPEQITAMLLTKLKETSVNALQAQVHDCVITCPVYFSNAERKALLDAAQIAGLNVLRLMNETTATALFYGFYKQDLPEEKPRNVVFVDCGHSSLQVSACAFTKGKLKMIASTWDHIGGRDFDYVLAEHFVKVFQERYKINAKSNPRAYLRLLTEVEKLKKQMSANSTKLPLNIECFMNDIDVTSSMQRVDMEALCTPLFERVEQTFKRLLHESKLNVNDIHSVEIVGGSSRIPAIKNLIEQVFGKPASTTLNQDESVSRGAALQCAIMSPVVRVREFGVTDIQNYAVKINWEGDSSSAPGEVEVFPVNHPAPFSRLLTLQRKEPFTLTVQYNADQIPFPDPIIGQWRIKDVKPSDKGEPQDVKVKVRINHHGIVLIAGATLVDKKELEEVSSGDSVNQQQEPMATDPPAPQQSSEEGGEPQQPPQQNSGEPMDTAQDGGEKKKKTTKAIDLPMDVTTPGYSHADLQNLIQQEARMIASDAKETQRVDARNALEEFIYDMRNKIQDGALERYVLEGDRSAICSQLNDLENWLYEEGEYCDRETYADKLQDLRAKTDPIKERAHNYESCPAYFEELKHAIANAVRLVNENKQNAGKVEPVVSEAVFINISELASKAEMWLETSVQHFSRSPLTSDCPVKASEIRQEIQKLNNAVTSAINQAKSKPAAAKAPPKDATTASDAGAQPEHQNGDDAAEGQKKGQANMDKNAQSNNVHDDQTMEVE